jgi:molecular chaperone Hsp33
MMPCSMSTEPDSTDCVIRSMTDDGAFRVIAAITTATARGALAAQRVRGELGLRLAELMTGAILVRETTVPGRRVQLVLRDRAGNTLVADALPDGTNRGLVNLGAGGDVVGDCVLQVNYTLPTGALHQGIVHVPDGADVSTALMRYMRDSEQTVSMVVVEALGESDVRSAGGYLVQLLPEAEPPMIEAMTERLGQLEKITALLAAPAPSAEGLVEAILGGFPHSQLASSPIRFGCTCSRERVLLGLSRLPAEDLQSMVDAGEPLEVRCDACGAMYDIPPAALQGLVDGDGDGDGDGDSDGDGDGDADPADHDGNGHSPSD